jgi:CRISPR system Cascade subunit CasC
MKHLKYIIVHWLAFCGPMNANRDESGRPKTSLIGGTLRGRHSSQMLKKCKGDHLRNGGSKKYETSIQTSLIGQHAYDKLIEGGVLEDLAEEVTYGILGAFIDVKKKKAKRAEETKRAEEKRKKGEKEDKEPANPFKMEAVKIQQCEFVAIENLIAKVIEGYKPTHKDYDFLQRNIAVDNALFGRMLAKRPMYDVDAALSMAQGFSVNACPTEEDYFTATDALQKDNGHKGSAHLDRFYFHQGSFYYSMIIDLELLIKNLQDNEPLAIEIIKELIKICAMASPTANKNRCAGSQNWASYMMIEKTNEFPRQLGLAFETPIEGPNVTEKAIKALVETKESFDKTFYELPSKSLDQINQKGTLQELLDFVSEESK